LLDKSDDQAFIDDSVAAGKAGDVDRSKVKIVFTSLHGTSTNFTRYLDRSGLQISHCKEQAVPDGFWMVDPETRGFGQVA
jgi:phosphoglucomutase